MSQSSEQAAQAYADLLRALDIPLSDPASTAQLASQLLIHLTREANCETPHLSLIEAPHSDWVVLDEMPFYSLCEHHFVPFFGTAKIEYLPNKYIAGLGGFFRMLDHFARQPQLQERLTQQLCDALFEELQPKVVRLTLKARQMCVELNGQPAITVETRAERSAK